MPLTEIKNGDNYFLLIVAFLTVVILLDFLPQIQEHLHWIKFVGVCIIVADFDVNDGVSLSIP